MKINIEKILEDYLQDIITVVSFLKVEGERRAPTKPWGQTLYPSGEIKEQNLSYKFHGMGCLVKWEGKVIDFDFRGDQEREIWGIDIWFAAHYIKSLGIKGLEEKSDCAKLVSKTLDDLVDRGDFVKFAHVFFKKEEFQELKALYPALYSEEMDVD